MNNNTPIFTENPSSFHDALTEVLQSGAKHLIQQAIEAELREFMSTFSSCYPSDGHPLVVRNGYQLERTVVTGIGAVPVRMLF